MIHYWRCTRAERAQARHALRYGELSPSAKVNEAASAWAAFLLGVTLGVTATVLGFAIANLISGNQRAIPLLITTVVLLALIGKTTRTTARFWRLAR